jgi:hypothetical protein
LDVGALIVYRRSCGRATEFEVDFRPVGREHVCAGTGPERLARVLVWVLKCPTCSTWSRLRRPRHFVRVHKDGTISIFPTVLCPNPACGWFVTIRRSVALDVRVLALEERMGAGRDVPLLARAKLPCRAIRGKGEAILALF